MSKWVSDLKGDCPRRNLARREDYGLTYELAEQLRQVVHGHTGQHDRAAAREGIA